MCPWQHWLLSCIAGVLAAIRGGLRASRRRPLCRPRSISTALQGLPAACHRQLSRGSFQRWAPCKPPGRRWWRWWRRLGGVSCFTASTLIIRLITYALYCLGSGPSRVRSYGSTSGFHSFLGFSSFSSRGLECGRKGGITKTSSWNVVHWELAGLLLGLLLLC